ncbi:hypothetical protein SPOG_03998 [Schizosaccharomyces cryophilus OY26]|uniref:Uncharacterized protein n=1 Tax=Schizosaccharomyces cryophilus (strain OY26 / ATCC MYA-4695 / CBS 11777 / NBRC 106824 / NRRL Y48691) TaxID=653667 RepID=S9W6B7_SCHCR|nr:uncharacterized protein SPOG_03998 [Schizosaccharomyces cryophilus OY26]EPY54104.1 hypothetical protein SPOG_03998 [Schizosaccharomyces cryophilus OY26]
MDGCQPPPKKKVSFFESFLQGMQTPFPVPKEEASNRVILYLTVCLKGHLKTSALKTISVLSLM